MTRLPTWLKITIPVVVVLGFLALLLATATRMLIEELPEHAQETIVQRFREELDVLARAAEDFPFDPCGEMETDDLMGRLDEIRAWQERMASDVLLLADPVILSAEVVISCGDHDSSFQLKAFEAKAPLWTSPLSRVPEERPSVRLWYSGTRRVVRYEDRIAESAERLTSARLLLDLDGLNLR